MTEEDVDIDELREQNQKGSRIAAAADQSKDEIDILVEEYRAVLAGEASRTLSFRDEVLAGLLHAADSDDDLHDTLAEALQEELDADADLAADRSELIRQLLRVGLRNAAPEIAEDAKEAYGVAVTEDAL
jgi:transcriptional regulator